MLNDIVRPAPITAAGAAWSGAPALSPPLSNGQGLELAIEAVSLRNDGVCADHWLLLAFEATTGMVASYNLVSEPGRIRQAARTAVAALSELHVPEGAEIDVACGRFPAPLLVSEIKKMSGRAKIMAIDGWAQRLAFDRIAAEIGRQVRGVAAYELAAGWEGFDGPDERLFFLECVVDQVLYWYHRRPAAVPGSKSPIERWAARNARPSTTPARS